MVNTDVGSANSEFLSLVEFSEGVASKENRNTIYNQLAKEFETRTFESSGNFVIDPFRSSTKEKVSNISLNTHELISLFNLDLSKEPRLEKVRDMFLFGCYTGLRFSDFSKIKPQYINLENSIIHIPTQKTGEDVSLPILPIAKLIINKYKDKTPNSLPPSIANQHSIDI